MSPRLASLARRLLARSQTQFSLLDQGLVSGFGFMAGIATARLVDIASFGRFALVMIFVGLAQNIHNAVFTAPMMTLVGSRNRDCPAYMASVLTAAALVSAFAGIVVAALLAGFFAMRGDALPLGFLAATASVAATQNLIFTLRRLLFACALGLRATMMDALRAGAFLLALGVLRLAGIAMTVEAILLLLAGTALLCMLPFMTPFLPRRRRMVRLGALAGRHVRLARWLLPVVFITFGQEQVVWIMAGGLLGDHAIGGLRAAQYLIGLVLLLLAATENILPVGAARAFSAEGRAGLDRYLVSTGLRLGLLIALPLVVIAIPAGSWLTLVFGAAYEPFAGCLRILAVAALLIHVRDMAAQLFRATQRTGVIFQAFAASLVVSLACLYPLLTQAGLVGAALVVLIGHATSMTYLLLAAVTVDRDRAHARYGRAAPTTR